MNQKPLTLFTVVAVITFMAGAMSNAQNPNANAYNPTQKTPDERAGIFSQMYSSGPKNVSPFRGRASAPQTGNTNFSDRQSSGSGTRMNGPAARTATMPRHLFRQEDDPFSPAPGARPTEPQTEPPVGSLPQNPADSSDGSGTRSPAEPPGQMPPIVPAPANNDPVPIIEMPPFDPSMPAPMQTPSGLPPIVQPPSSVVPPIVTPQSVLSPGSEISVQPQFGLSAPVYLQPGVAQPMTVSPSMTLPPIVSSAGAMPGQSYFEECGDCSSTGLNPVSSTGFASGFESSELFTGSAVGGSPENFTPNTVVQYFGGGNWLNDVAPGFLSFPADFEGGYGVGASLGRRISPRARVSVEFALRSNETGTAEGPSPAVIQTEGDLEVYSGMVNFHLDFMRHSRISPYIGAGIGGAYADGDLDFLQEVGFHEEEALAYQAIGGLLFSASKTVGFFVEYRFFGTEDFATSPFGDPDFGGPLGTDIAEDNYFSHSLFAGLHFEF